MPQRVVFASKQLTLTADRFAKGELTAHEERLMEAAVEDLTTRGQAVRNEMADTVVRGAAEVARQAAAFKTDRAVETTAR